MPAALDEDPLVRRRFAKQAMKADRVGSSRTAWELCEHNAAKGLHDGVWPHAGFYVFTALPLPPDPNAAHVSDALAQNQKIYEAALQHGASPLDPSGKALGGGWALHELVVDHPAYPIKNADDQIIEENIEIYATACAGANVISLCAGNGKKDARIYRLMTQRNVRIQKWYINDISSTEAREAKRELVNAGLDPARIEIISGNITSHKFFQQPVFEQLRRDDAPTVLMVHGGTLFNAFSIEHIGWFLWNFKEHFKVGTEFFISGDSTANKTDLRSFYLYPEVKVWLIAGFVFGMRTHGFYVDPIALDVRLDIEPRAFHHELTHVIENKKFQRLRVHNGKGNAVSYTLGVGDIPCQSIVKVREENLRHMIIQAGHEVAHRLPYVDRNGRFPSVKHSIWHFYNSTNKAIMRPAPVS